MKKLFTLFAFVLLLSSSGFAQKAFAPAGADWYYDLPAGVAHAHLVADTVIQGRACKHLKTETGVGSPYVFYGFAYYALPDRFLYNSGDTTFVYNNSFKRFTPLYIWNVNAHDTVVIPAIQGAFNPVLDTVAANSHIRFVVDSVKMILYDTSMLKTVYVSTMSGLNSNYIYQHISYAEKLGTLSYGTEPWCGNCGIPLDDRIPSLGAVRCYHDSTYAIKIVADDCSKGIVLGVSNIKKQSASFSLFPNPANDHLTITEILLTVKYTPYLLPTSQERPWRNRQQQQ